MLSKRRWECSWHFIMVLDVTFNDFVRGSGCSRRPRTLIVCSPMLTTLIWYDDIWHEERVRVRETHGRWQLSIIEWRICPPNFIGWIFLKSLGVHFDLFINILLSIWWSGCGQWLFINVILIVATNVSGVCQIGGAYASVIPWILTAT